MSIVDHNGQPIAYGWNDIAAQEKFESDRTLRLISDEEFARRFPHVVLPIKAVRTPRSSQKAVRATV